jgi:hypothetical protein
MEKKHFAVIAVVVVIGALVFGPARWFLFTLRARDDVQKLGRFPQASEILALPTALRETARRHKLDPAQLQVRLAVEVRGMMGSGIPFTYVLVECTDGSRRWSYSVGSEKGHRIESSHSAEFLDALKAGGVDLSKMQEAPSPVVVPATPGAGAQERTEGE